MNATPINRSDIGLLLQVCFHGGHAISAIVFAPDPTTVVIIPVA